MRKKTDNWLR